MLSKNVYGVYYHPSFDRWPECDFCIKRDVLFLPIALLPVQTLAAVDGVREVSACYEGLDPNEPLRHAKHDAPLQKALQDTLLLLKGHTPSQRKETTMFRKPSFISARHGAWPLLFSVLLFSLVACSSIPSSSQPLAAHSSTPAYPQPTVTTLPAGRLLYQANWTRGLTGWRHTTGWQVIAGYLQTQASSENTLTIPFQPAVVNYALEIRFQIVRTLGNGAFFMVVAPRQAHKDGYKTGWREGLLGYIDPTGTNLRASTITSDYNVQDIWHTYRIEVRNNDLQMFDNGVFVGEMHSEQTRFLSNGPLSLNTAQVVARVSQLRLLSL